MNDRKFEYGHDSIINELGVTETTFWVDGICPNCREKTTALVIIPKIPDDYDHNKILNFRCICNKCSKEFIVDNENDERQN